MSLILCCDFGSTFTKLTVIDCQAGEIVAASRAFTTVDTGVMDGFNHGLDEIYRQCGINGIAERNPELFTAAF